MMEKRYLQNLRITILWDVILEEQLLNWIYHPLLHFLKKLSQYDFCINVW